MADNDSARPKKKVKRSFGEYLIDFTKENTTDLDDNRDDFKRRQEDIARPVAPARARAAVNLSPNAPTPQSTAPKGSHRTSLVPSNVQQAAPPRHPQYIQPQRIPSSHAIVAAASKPPTTPIPDPPVRQVLNQGQWIPVPPELQNLLSVRTQGCPLIPANWALLESSAFTALNVIVLPSCGNSIRQRALSYLIRLGLDTLKTIAPDQLALGLKTLWYCYEVSIGLHVKERSRTAKMIMGLLQTLGERKKEVADLQQQLTQSSDEVVGLRKAKHSLCAEIVLYQDTVDDLDKQVEAEKKRARAASERDQATITKLRQEMDQFKLLALQHKKEAADHQ